MKATKDTVVSFHYRLTDADGRTIEDSHGNPQPMMVLLGHGGVIPGVEKALEGQEAGAALEVEVPPEEGYGPHQPGLIQRVPKKYFQNAKALKPGTVTALALRRGGMQQVTVHKVGMSTVDVDVNHPLAGKTLHFALEVTEVRGATPEELAHGHAHPPGAAHAHAADEGAAPDASA